MIAHLIRSEAQRLRTPIFLFWIILTLTSIPWLISSTTTLHWITPEAGSRSGLPFSLPAPASPFLSAEVLRYLTSFFAIGTTAAISLTGKTWQATRPISPHALILSRFVLIIVAVVLPMTLINTTLLLTRHFSFLTLVTETITAFLLLLSLHLLIAAFARHCHNFLLFLTAFSATIIALNFLTSKSHYYDNNLRHIPLLNPWCQIHPGQLTTFAAWIGLSLILLFVLPRLLRLHRSSPATPFVACLSLCLSALASNWIPPSPQIPPSSASFPQGSEFQVSLASPPRILSQPLAKQLTLSLDVTTHPPLPENTFITWAANTSSPYAFRNLPMSDRGSPTDIAALHAATHGTYATPDSPGYSNSQPYFNIPRQQLDQTPILSLPLLARIFRYETVAFLPLPLATPPLSLPSGRLTLHTIPGTSDLSIETTLESPLLHHLLQPSSSFNPLVPLEDLRFLLWIPSIHAHIPLQDVQNDFTPLATSLSLQHKVWTLPDAFARRKDLDLQGATLRILQPKILATLHHTLALDLKQASQAEPSGWLTIGNHGLTPENYATLLEQRPNPDSASEQEVARYLRIASAAYRSPVAAQDLAAFANRFPELFTLHAARSPVAQAITLGVAENHRSRVIRTLQNHPNLIPHLAATLHKRQWQKDLKKEIVQVLSQPPSNTHIDMNGSSSNALFLLAASFGDPEIDPVLVENFRLFPTNRKYDLLKRNPRVAQPLDQVIQEAVEDLDPAALLALDDRAYTAWRVVDRFKIPIHHGNPLAFKKLFTVYTLLDPQARHDLAPRFRAFFTPQTLNNHSFEEIFTHHTPSHFSFQPLTSQWQLQPTRP